MVPLTTGTPNAPSYLLAFDNFTGGIVTSVAVVANDLPRKRPASAWLYHPRRHRRANW